MAKFAPFEGPGRFLKGNLHTHTTRSDGKLSLEDTVARYRGLGYDFLCITDHNRYYRGGDLQGVTLLPGMESDAMIRRGEDMAVHHYVAIGTGDSGYAHDERITFEDTDTPDKAQAMLDELRAHDNLVLLAHPYWSHADYADYGHLKGLWGMEVYNHGCHLENDTGYAANAWNQMLWRSPRGGDPLYAAATDDGHLESHFGGGWVMVYAEDASASAILAALKQGRFYASTGPEITGLTYKDGTIEVKCSPCARIMFLTGGIGGGKAVYDHECGGAVDCASYTPPKDIRYIRVQCVDDHGCVAYSQPIML